MTRRYSMGYLTANGADPLEAAAFAAAHGYDMISFRLLPAGPGETLAAWFEDPALVREVKAALRDTGLALADVEMIRIKPGTRPDAFDRFLDLSAELGAAHVLVAVDDTDEARATDCYAALCPRLAEYGLTADLEFMPWTGVKDLAAARRMVDAADHPAAAVLFDSLHFDRCGATLAEFASLPRAMMNYIQICDGPVPYDGSDADLIRIARTARLIPGDGGIDLKALVPHIPDDIPVSVEVPNAALAREIGPSELARRALAATKRLLGD